MRFSNVSLVGLGVAEGPIRVTSAAIEDRLRPLAERLGLGPRMLGELTGIIARRTWPEHVMPSDIAAEAGEAALRDAGLDRARLGALVSTSVCRDYLEPSTAALAHHKLGLSADCVNFDLGNACLAFLSGVQVVGNMIERGQIEAGVVVDGENSARVLEATLGKLLGPGGDPRSFRDNFATLTLGSGGAAAVLCRSDLAPPERDHRVVGAVTLAATEHVHLCRGTEEGMTTDASGLLVAGVALARRTYDKAQRELGWGRDTLDELLLHQVSEVHTDKLCHALSLDPARVTRIYPEYGNIGPASIPFALAKAREAGRLARGKRLGLLGIGSGLNCAMMEVRW
ncbi:MAG: 3-oxoacyl-ACP synthase III [Polyangiaceae bacterium]|nr:3-oxoacyl-ACP synthase III [Polyangiaceae bacterium]